MSGFRLTRRADRDLIDIYLYTCDHFGRDQAERYTENTRSCFVTLADNPKMGRRADRVRPGLRRHEHGRHVIFYREDVGGLLILAVLHSSMRPDLVVSDLA